MHDLLDSFKARADLSVAGRNYEIFRLGALAGLGNVDRLPFSLRVLLENLLRHEDGVTVTRAHVEALAKWDPKATPADEIAFHPARVLLQDFTGVPAVVDLAAMRDAMARMGGDPQRINPLQPVDLVIDHSVQIDAWSTSSAYDLNVRLEYQRNQERYAFLRWGQGAFHNFRVVPPGTGICHQVNLEYLARTVWTSELGGRLRAYPDTLVGTDSHTTMVNGLSVLGWGVGGIEAEAAMLGQPVAMLIPEVVGFRLHGTLAPGATATDVVLTVTQLLRKRGVVGKFVEFYGPGLGGLRAADRATIANMAPEYGATCGFFPVDEETLAYLRLSNRAEDQIALVEAYCKEQGLFRTDATTDPIFSDTLELDLGTVETSLAGPKRPQDRVVLSQMRPEFRRNLAQSVAERHPDQAAAAAQWAASEAPEHLGPAVAIEHGDLGYDLAHGSVVIAAITSCTNTSNPSVMLAAGLLARNAVRRGLHAKPWVKASLAPGSKVVTEYLAAAGVTPYLEALGFHLAGYGCTTCIGNSGPLPDRIVDAIKTGDLVVATVLSGNRNFEGRVSPHARANYLASPPLVVAYALAGTVDLDPTRDPIGRDPAGEPVFLRDLWPSDREIQDALAVVDREMFARQYANVLEGDATWRGLPTPTGDRFVWDASSTYVKHPPYFVDMQPKPAPLCDIAGARVLAKLGDSITTDHISPAGSIAKDGAAAAYLREQGVAPVDFNQYGARRGNHEVMIRGTFANIRLRNELVPGVEGGVTRHFPDGTQTSIYEAAESYRREGVPLVVLAGHEYGTGSSRDWAAKGTYLLGVRAVLAKSFERIHRSNLAGMGVLPLTFEDGMGATELELAGDEVFSISGIAEGLVPGKRLDVSARASTGSVKVFTVKCRLDTPQEVEYYRNGGILHYVLRRMLDQGRAAKAAS